MEIKDLVLLDGVRTPMAEFGQSFADIRKLEFVRHCSLRIPRWP